MQLVKTLLIYKIFSHNQQNSLSLQVIGNGDHHHNIAASRRHNSLVNLQLEALSTAVKQLLIHLHEQLQRVVYQAVDCPTSHDHGDWLS